MFIDCDPNGWGRWSRVVAGTGNAVVFRHTSNEYVGAVGFGFPSKPPKSDDKGDGGLGFVI
jgi:hypothetical protein